MTQLCLPRPKDLADLIPVPPRGLDAGEGSGHPVHARMSPWGSSWVQLLDNVLGLGALGMTIQAVFSTTGPALLLLLLLVSFLTFDLFHRPAGGTWPQHKLLTRGQSQGQEALLLQMGADALLLLLLLMGLGLLLRACGMPLTLLGLAFCLHPWAWEPLPKTQCPSNIQWPSSFLRPPFLLPGWAGGTIPLSSQPEPHRTSSPTA
uniref:Chromosome 20 open reading frame 141 n=1 Tax=Aotus nancymaae TaxID=37293 RepID=A0A2K5ER01_AOTNA